MTLRRSRRLRSVAAVLMLSASQIPFARAADGSYVVSDDDLLILQLRLGRFVLSDGLIGYQTPHGACVDISDLARALDFPIEVEDGVAAGWFLNEDNSFSLNLEERTLEISGEAQTLGDGDVFNAYGDICVSLSAASKWFPVSLELDFENATIIATSVTPLPVEEREARKKRRAQLNAVAATPPSKTDGVTPEYRWSRWPAIDASVTASMTDQSQVAGGDFVLTTDFAKLSAEVYAAGDTNEGLSTVRGRIGRQSPAGDLGGPLGLTTVMLGDVSAPQNRLSATSKTGRGAFISSYALHQPDIFDSTTVRGELLDGWEVELYRNDVLLYSQMSREDGRYEFIGVPVLFGRNEIRLVFYGPQGQIREEYKDFYVGESLTPHKEKKAFLAITQQEKATLYEKQVLDRPGVGALRINGRFEYGLTKKVTVGVGVASYQIGGDRHTYVDASVQANVGKAGVILDGSLDLNGGAAAAISIQSGAGQVSLFAAHEEYFDYESELTPPSAADPIRRRNAARMDFVVLPRRKTALPITLGAEHIEYSSGRREIEGSTRTSAILGPIAASNELSATWTEQEGSETFRLSGVTLFNYYTSIAALRGEVTYDVKPRSQLTGAALTADLRFSEKLGSRISAGYDARSKQSSVGLSVNRSFKSIAISAFGRASTDRSFSAGLNLSFSLQRTPKSGVWRMGSHAAARNGSAFVRAFIDNDNDRVFSEGDETISDAEFLVNGQKARHAVVTDDGVMLSGVAAYEASTISLDMSTVEDPYLINARDGVDAVIARPGVVSPIDIPLSKTGEIVGETVIMRNGEVEGIGDVELQLIGQEGEIIATATSEFDGFFLFDKVPYGAYALQLAPEQAERLGVTAEALDGFEIKAGDDLIEGVRFQLNRTRSDDKASSEN